MPRFVWSEQVENAAGLIAQSILSRVQIAERIGVVPSTLTRWLARDDFRARVEELSAEIAAEVRRIGISTVTSRVRAQNDRWMRMQRLIEARADDPSMQGVPGGSTGLLIRKTKSIGYGENASLVDEYEVDTGLLRELREHEKQAAQELGQWQEKIGLETNADAQPIPSDVAAIGLAAMKDAMTRRGHATLQVAASDDEGGDAA